MNITSHGTWERYTPDKLPVGAPGNAMFARRIADGVDWYEYVRDGKAFQEASIKLTVTNGIVGAAVTEAKRLFPGGSVVLEVHDVHVADPQATFGRKRYDVSGQTFHDEPPMALPEMPTMAMIEGILKRLDALERNVP